MSLEWKTIVTFPEINNDSIVGGQYSQLRCCSAGCAILYVLLNNISSV